MACRYGVHDDYEYIGAQREDHAHRQPLEEQLAGARKVQVWRDFRLFLGCSMLLLGQWLAPRPQLFGLLVRIMIAAGGNDAAHGKGGEVEDQEDDGVGDLQVVQNPAGGRIRHPRRLRAIRIRHLRFGHGAGKVGSRAGRAGQQSSTLCRAPHQVAGPGG